MAHSFVQWMSAPSVLVFANEGPAVMRRSEIATLLNAVITSKLNIGDKTVMH